MELEADHRRHAEIENAIRDLKYGVGMNHMPSGRFAANAAWLAVQVMAHNLARWTARIGLDERIVTTKALRRRFFSLAGRLTLHLPKRWPWETLFSRALARLRAIPLPRWDVHFGCLEDDREDSTVPHITFGPQMGGHRQCGLAICTLHLGFGLGGIPCISISLGET